jgi:hypothetical protein
MLRVVILAATLAGVSSLSSAHDADCRGRPPSSDTKLACCGKAEYHALDPSQVHRDAYGNYVVDVDGLTLVVPERVAEPSGDECSAIFFNRPRTGTGAILQLSPHGEIASPRTKP